MKSTMSQTSNQRAPFSTACTQPPPPGRVITPAFTTKPTEYLSKLGNTVITTPDDVLIQQFLAGDHYSFNDLVAKHYRRVWFIAKRYTDTLEEASDVLHDGLLKAYHKIHLFQGNSSFGTWLHRLVVNNAHDLYNKRRNHDTNVTIDNAEATPHIDRALSHDPTPDLNLSIAIRMALNGLSCDHRNAIMLVDFLDYDLDRAAEQLGVKEGTIKSRRARARQQLRTQLSEEAEEAFKDTPSD